MGTLQEGTNEARRDDIHHANLLHGDHPVVNPLDTASNTVPFPSPEKKEIQTDELRLIKELSAFVSTPPPKKVYGMHAEIDIVGGLHPHASCRYQKLELRDYFKAAVEVVKASWMGAATLNFHLPYETQFIKYRDRSAGNRFMSFVDGAGHLFGVSVVWENAALLDGRAGKMIENTSYVPTDRKLCLDIGHLMLGSKSKAEALERIDHFLEKHGENVKHLHLHINDFSKDSHSWDPKVVIEFLGVERFKRLVEGRTFVFERGGGAPY